MFPNLFPKRIPLATLAALTLGRSGRWPVATPRAFGIRETLTTRHAVREALTTRHTVRETLTTRHTVREALTTRHTVRETLTTQRDGKRGSYYNRETVREALTTTERR